MKKLFLTSVLILVLSPAFAADHEAFNAVADQCNVSYPGKTIAGFEARVNCIANSESVDSYSATDLDYISVSLKQVAQAKAGQINYQQLKMANRAYRAQQNESEKQKQIAYSEQRRLTNAVENIPLQNAWWAVTINGINQAGSGYTPRMYRSHF